MHAQSTLDYGPDFFGEEHSLEELRKWLVAKGVHPELAEDQIQALTSANNTLEVEAHRVPIEPFGQENKRFSKDHGQAQQNGSEDTVSLCLTAEENAGTDLHEDQVDDEEGADTPGTIGSSDLREMAEVFFGGDLEPPATEPGAVSDYDSEVSAGGTEVFDGGSDTDSGSDESQSAIGHFDEAEAKAALQTAVPPPPPTSGFVIVRSDKGRMRRLHFIGACHRRPGEHYTDFTVCEHLPAADLVDAKCKQCFRLGGPPLAPAASREVMSADESDTSSSRDSSSRSPTPMPNPA